jgi:hypothetical protein
MFYDDEVTTPERDAQAMDKHVARLQKMTGKPLREKIYWVRGQLIGKRQMAIAGLALGSPASPRDWNAVDDPEWPNVDRHELAHAVLHQHYEPDTDPPTLLVEGWAESQSGMSSKALAAAALESRRGRGERLGPDHRRLTYLRELIGPSWYHRIGGPVYIVGGAFADHLLRKYEPEKFLQLYFSCRQESFAEDAARVYGVPFDTLENNFWQEMEVLGSDHIPRELLLWPWHGF